MANHRAGTAKHWCFTLNDREDELEHTDVLEIWGPHADYLVFQEEKGANGTKHYQGYIEFTKRCRPAGLTKHFKPHWEKRQGTRNQARDYCMKGESRVAGPWEHGDWSGKCGEQGKRSDLIDVVERIKEGKSQREILEEFPVSTIRCYSAIDKARNLYRPSRVKPLTVTLCVGTPGTGKTQNFWNFCDEHETPGWEVPPGKDIWFSGYSGEENVLIDDFAGNIGLTQLLKILDKYPLSCPTKGSHVWWCPTNICVTSNAHPWQWYDYETRQDSYAALKRRFHFVILFKKVDGEYTMETLDVEDYFENQKLERVTKNKYQGPATWHCDGQS